MREIFKQIWNGFHSLISFLSDLLNFQLIVVDESPVTVGVVLFGMILFAFGYYICLRLSRSLEKKLLSHFDIEPSLIHNFKNIVFYILLLFLALFILRVINIPLTAFTLVAGAFAVGAGLGAQNVLKNFISGLVIMLEQPIKVGDIVEIDGLQGTVEQIGARGTKIKSTDNTHIVVPNSSFLESNLLNWTLQDNIVRGEVSVGVAYESDVKIVEALLIQAASEQDRVLQHPEPQVIFENFGSCSLDFFVYFWAQVPHPMMLPQIKSKIRFRITSLFHEKNIVIPFPQRDIRMDLIKPVSVEILEASNAKNRILKDK